MMLNYVVRLICLSLAAFFLVHTAAGLLVALATRAAIRAARRMPSRRAERLLYSLRLLPAALAMFLVLGVCVPSYLWFETEVRGEEVGAVCLAAAALTLTQFAYSFFRGLRAAAHTRRHAHAWELAAQSSHLPGAAAPVWILDTRPPVLALAGVFHSHLVISRPVIQALSPAQLAAALRHEEAHRRSHDNLKRLFLMLSPGLLPGVNTFSPLERAWARCTEWAADDEAVAGNAESSLSLAAALVRIARLGGKTSAPPLTAAFLGDTAELAERVDRLLLPAAPVPAASHIALVIASAAALSLVAGCLLHPASLASAHRLLEDLIH
jgi:Zn-dependent protease with chaperone function